MMSKMMSKSPSVIGFWTLLLLVSGSSSFSIVDLLNRLSKNKKCSAINAKDNLSLEQLSGAWYIKYQVNPVLRGEPICQTIEIERLTKTKVNIAMTTRITPSLVLKGVGTGTVENIDVPAEMSWKWSFAPEVETTIFADTDYENYAVFLTCNAYGRISTGFVLSRYEDLPDIYLTKAQEVLNRYMDTTYGKLTTKTDCDLIPLSPENKVLELGKEVFEGALNTLFD